MGNKEVIFITGCSTGIGKDICRIMADKGYTVIATARKIEALKDVSASLKLRVDVTDRESIRLAVNQTIQKFKKIDILVNNAGYSVRGALEDVAIDDVKMIFDVNVFGIINMIQEVIPEMRKLKSGKIINIGSISGKFTQAVNGNYCASKHAVEAINDALRLELKKYNVQSTVIEPGPMNTEFFQTLSKKSDRILENPDSAYVDLYEADLEYRKMQKRSGSKESAAKICRIIMSDKLKPRYKVSVPLTFRILLKFSDSAKEFILLRR